MLASLDRLAKEGRLYVSVILHGGGQEERLALAVSLARTLLCAGDPQGAPDCSCRHCRRIEIPRQGDAGAFTPTFTSSGRTCAP